MKAWLRFGLVLAMLLAVGCRSRFTPLAEPQPLPYENNLKELIASGFDGPVLGFPETISGKLGPDGEWLFGGKPSHSPSLLSEVSAFYPADVAPRNKRLGRLGEGEKNYLPVFQRLCAHLKEQNKLPSKEKDQDPRADWTRRSLQSIQGGDIKDFEVLFEKSKRDYEDWVPYLLFYWRHTSDVEIKRRAVFIRPRFKEGLTIQEQLKALGIEYANPVWVHPRIGMIYQVVKPTPKKPVFILTTTPKLGPPRIEAVMDWTAPDIAELFGFTLYQSLETMAFYTFNKGKNAQLIHDYEPFLACHVLNKDIQEHLDKIVRTAQRGDKTAVSSAFAALKNSKSLDTYPLILLDAEKAAYAHGLLTESEKTRLLGYALKTIERFDAKTKDCQRKRLFATEAGTQWIKSAFVGVPVEDEKPLNVEVQSLYGTPQPSAADGTPLQVALANMIKLLPVPRLNNSDGYVYDSDNLVLATNAGIIGRLNSYLQPKNFESRKAAGAPVWDFFVPNFKIRSEALTYRTETRTEKVPYKMPTKEYNAYSVKRRELYRQAEIAYKSIPAQTVTSTRSEWGAVKYVNGGRVVGTGYAYRPVTTTSVGLDLSSRAYKRYAALKAQLYLLEFNEPKNKYLTKYLSMPVHYQIWSMSNESWDVRVSHKGKDVGAFPAIASFKKELKRHSGSTKHGIRAVDEWTSAKEMKAALEKSTRKELIRKIFRKASLRGVEFSGPYLDAVCPNASRAEKALEAAWLRFWFTIYYLRLHRLPEADKLLLPMGVLKLIHKKRNGIELASIASRYPGRKASALSSYPLHDTKYKRDFERPPFVIDRPGRLSKNKIHVEVSLENLQFALVLASELESYGATLTALSVRAKSKGKKLKYDICVENSTRSEAAPLYRFLSKQSLFKTFGSFGDIRSGSCPKCEQDDSLKGPEGKELDWGANTIHISD